MFSSLLFLPGEISKEGRRKGRKVGFHCRGYSLYDSMQKTRDLCAEKKELYSSYLK